MNIDDTELFRIKRNIIKKLYAKKAFRKGHLLFNTLKSGIPKHLVGFVGDVLEQLIKDELVVTSCNIWKNKIWNRIPAQCQKIKRN